MDWLLAALLLVGGGIELLVGSSPPEPWWQAAYVTGASLAIVLRRIAPVWSAGAFLLASVGVSLLSTPYQMLSIGVAFTVLPFFYAAELSGRRLALVLTMLVAAVAVRSAADPLEDWGAAAADQGFVALAAAAGSVVWHYRRRVEQVAKSASLRIDDAIALERGWMARELHDIIGHGIGVMIIQADSARHVLAPGNDEVHRALVAIEKTGRESLRDMRRLLDLLREDDAEGALLDPTPRMGDLDDLVQAVRRTGLPVDLTIDGDRADVVHGVALTAFRVVQEALTNVLRHAGPAHARVVVRYGAHDVTVEVSDDGRLRPARSANARGLIGLGERVRLYGGTLTAGPEGSQWVVRATLPLDGSALQ